MKTFRRPLPTALVLTLSAGAVLSVPQAAEAAAPTLVTSAAKTLLSTALEYGLGIAVDELWGTGSGPVTLSDESYAEIRNIVDEVVGGYFSEEHLSTLQDAYDAADKYSCDPDFLEECDEELDTYEILAISAANDMVGEGLAGGPSFGLASALELSMYIEHRDVCEQRQHDCFDDYTDLVTGTSAFSIVPHMTGLLDEWHALEDNVTNQCSWPGYWTDIHGELRSGYWTNPVDPSTLVTCQQAYQEYVAGLEDLRDSVLGGDFDALLDEFIYYSTGAWTSGLTSTELFCDSYDDAAVTLKSGGGVATMTRTSSDYTMSWPHGLKDVFTVKCNASQTKIWLQDYTGSYVRGRDDNDDYDIEPSATTSSDSTAWTAWLRPDGEWVLRNYKQGRYLGLTDFAGPFVTQDKEASELTIVVVN